MAGIPFNNLSSNIPIDSDLSFGGRGSHVLMAVAIPYVDPTPENEEITSTNVHFVNIAIMISIIIMLIISVIIFFYLINVNL